MKKRDPFAGWYTFVTLAKYGSFRRAAIELNQTVAAVSLAIKQLETQLNVSLFQRTTRSLKLTEAGELMLAKVEPALAQIESAQSEVQEMNAEAQGVLRMTAPEICHRWFMQDWLSMLARSAPKVQVDIHYSDALENVVHQSYDAGIRLASSVELDMIGIPIRKNLKSILVATPSYLAKRGVPNSIDELIQHECIMLKYGRYQQIDHWQLSDQGQIVTPPIQAKWTFSSIQATIDAAAAGLGLAYVLDEGIVKNELNSGSLVMVRPEWGFPQGEVMLYYPKGKTTAKLRALIDVIQQWQKLTQ